MHPILKCLLVLVGADGLAVVGTFFALFTAGPTVAAGERAVLSLGVLDLLLALAGCGALVWASSGLPSANISPAPINGSRIAHPPSLSPSNI